MTIDMLHLRTRIWYAIIVANYIALVLFIFQPFGINNYKHQFDIDLVFVLVLLLFDILICTSLITMLFLYRLVIKTNKKNLWVILAVDWFFLGTLFFYVYNILGEWQDYRFTSYLEFLYSAFALLIFPYAIIFYFQRKSEKESQLIKFKNQSGKVDLLIDPSLILLIKAEDNYINVHYLKNTSVEKKLIRNTLFQVKAILPPQQFIQCHRSYIINLKNIETLQFEGRKSELKMKYWSESVPVSPTEKGAILSRHQ